MRHKFHSLILAFLCAAFPATAWAGDLFDCKTGRDLDGRSLDCVKAAIESGRSPNERGDKLTPLMIAAAQGGEEIVRYLLDHGADPNKITEPVNFSPLMFAPEGPDSMGEDDRDAAKQARIVRMLLEAGADINFTAIDEQTDIGQRAMDRVIHSGDVAMARQFLKAGAQPHVVHENFDSFTGWTWLQWAVLSEYPEMVAFILSLPPDIAAGSVRGALITLKDMRRDLVEQRGNYDNPSDYRDSMRAITRISRLLQAARKAGRK